MPRRSPPLNADDTRLDTRALSPATPALRSGVSVRTRIVSSLLLLVLIALSSAGTIVYLVELHRIDQRIEADVDQELEELANLQRTQSFASAQETVSAFVRRNVPDEYELLVAWWDDAPKEVLRGGSTPDDLLRTGVREQVATVVRSGRSEQIDLPGAGSALITVQPVRGSQDEASLVLITLLDEASSGLRETMRTYVLVSAVALVVVGLGTAWQSGRLLAPLRDLSRATEQVSARDLSARLPERGNDDVTALTRTFNGMLDRLEASFTAQRQFLDDAGHELKTPLTVLGGHLELLDTTDPVEVAATRELLLDEVDRMGRLVEDLILLAKVRRPDFLRPGPTDTGDLTRSVLAKARALSPSREWQLDAAAEVRATVDEQRLTQALLQLADNAVKHTDAGAEIGIGSVVVSGTGGSSLTLWVRDSGDGVAPADREAIFERFGRAEVRAGDDGFGLGLSIVSAIAQASGGTVHVEDPHPPHPPGSRFVLTLPLIDAPEDPWPTS